MMATIVMAIACNCMCPLWLFMAFLKLFCGYFSSSLIVGSVLNFDKVGCVLSTLLHFFQHIPSYRNLNPPVNTIILSKRSRKLQIYKYSQISFSRATYKNFKIAYDLNKSNLPHHITMLRLVGIVLVLKIFLCTAPRK